LKPHTLKTWLAALLLGVFIGLAVIVPGVSGSTVAIIFGLYAGMLYALGHILNDFRRCFVFLLPIGLGCIVGFAAGFLVIQRVFEAYLVQVVCLFVGLMLGAVPALTRELKGARPTPLRGLLMTVGVLIPLAVCLVSILLGEGGESAAYTDFPVLRIVAYLPLGFLVSVTQIVPGLSATAILMAFGQFKPILESLHVSYVLEHPQVLFLYAALGVGFLVGIVSVSRLFSAVLERHPHDAFSLVVGLAFGSIASMLCNADMYATYTAWAAAGSIPWRTVAVAAVLLIVGFAASLALTRYELSRAEQKK
jgi:putative membrane protein